VAAQAAPRHKEEVELTPGMAGHRDLHGKQVMRITCLSGAAWVTITGQRDHMLQEGDVLHLQANHFEGKPPARLLHGWLAAVPAAAGLLRRAGRRRVVLQGLPAAILRIEIEPAAA
jgi:hypothetical protein